MDKQNGFPQGYPHPQSPSMYPHTSQQQQGYVYPMAGPNGVVYAAVPGQAGMMYQVPMGGPMMMPQQPAPWPGSPYCSPGYPQSPPPQYNPMLANHSPWQQRPTINLPDSPMHSYPMNRSPGPSPLGHGPSPMGPGPSPLGIGSPGRGRGRGRGAWQGVNSPGSSHLGGPPLSSGNLRCEACEKSFPVEAQLQAHLGTHVNCDQEGCSFSASGKMLKEHKLVVHGIGGTPKFPINRSKEAEEENRRWREERKKNYPTNSNVQRKEEEARGRRERGELLDDAARARRQRLREILQRQRELGCPVAEVPMHYIAEDDRPFGRGGRGGAKRERDDIGEGERGPKRAKAMQPTSTPPRAPPTPPSLIGLEGSIDQKAPIVEQRASTAEEAGVEVTKVNAQPCYYFQRGRCKKGNRCDFVHERISTPKKAGYDAQAPERATQAKPQQKRQPTLLEKLLAPEIRRDKSHLLQCIRFIVNNNFLKDYPKAPLKHFEWATEAEPLPADPERVPLDAAPVAHLLAAVEGEASKEEEVEDSESEDESPSKPRVGIVAYSSSGESEQEEESDDEDNDASEPKESLGPDAQGPPPILGQVLPERKDAMTPSIDTVPDSEPNGEWQPRGGGRGWRGRRGGRWNNGRFRGRGRGQGWGRGRGRGRRGFQGPRASGPEALLSPHQ